MANALRLPKGYSDFQKIRQEKYHYVDKSLLIEHVLNDSAQVILLPRPRRFGKTLNLSMLRYFFEKHNEDRSPLFAGLKIAQSEEAKKHFQRYPTIFITFKDLKEETWGDTLTKVKKQIAELYREYTYLLQSEALSTLEKKDIQALQQQKGTRADWTESLCSLCKYLHQVHGERVVLLIDEYDTPIHAAHEYGYYDEAISFFRSLLSAALKDNVHIFRGVMTGILRVAKESIFSGLNNLGVYSLMSTRYADMFGFTESEVQELVQLAGQPELMDSLRSWYNGYLFGGCTIYNPWSVVNYLEAPADGLRPYWVNTSDNAVIRTHVLSSTDDLKPDFEQLLHGDTIDKPIHENISMHDLALNSNMVWSLLLFTGYLKPVELYTVNDKPWAKLTIPNREVYACLGDLAQSWFSAYLQTSSTNIQQLLKAMVCGDEETLHEQLQTIVRDNASFHDVKESFFHGLVLGLLVNLSESHEVYSNRESGFGRCDVLVSPKHAGKPGIALEFKVVNKRKKETIEEALASAMKQLRDRDYVATLRERGAEPIYMMAIAFEGKRVELEIKTWGLPTLMSKNKRATSSTSKKKASTKVRARTSSSR